LLLGILPHHIKSLQNRGVFRVIRITSTLRYLLREEVEVLLAKIDSLPVDLNGGQVVPISEFCRDKGIHLARLIDLWLSGEIETGFYRGDGVGFQAIKVDWNLLYDRPTVALDQNLKLPDAARYLKICIKSIRRLRDSGYLDEVQHRNPDTNHLKRYITQSSIRELEDRYLTLGQIAAEHRLAPMHLARKLDRAT